VGTGAFVDTVQVRSPDVVDDGSVMPTHHPLLTAHLRTHHGIVTVGAFDDLDLTRAGRRALVQSGELTPVFDGVYRHALWPDTLESRLASICATDDTVVICCGGATRLWAYRKCGRTPLCATTTSTGLRLPPTSGLVLHRCPVMPPEHVHDRGDGIRVTSPARTMFDISKHVGWNSLESAIEQGIRRGDFDIPALYDVGRLLCRRGRAGSAMFGAVLNSRPAWRRPADSHPEIQLRAALERAGVRLHPQAPVRLPNGQTIHPDLGDPDVGFFIEIDDHEWHGGRLSSRYDDDRDRQVRLIGGWIERVSTDDLDPVNWAVVRDLVRAYQRQAQHSRRLRVAQ
jgi:hypothetical protein